MKVHRYSPGEVHVMRLDTGDDLVPRLTRYATDNGITAAWFSYLGAVQQASLRYFDQQALEYRDFEIERPLEILSGVGNVSMLDGAPFVHTHAAFGDADGRAYGGHVNQGTIAFLIEVRLECFEGDPPVRMADETTGLMIWGPDEG